MTRNPARSSLNMGVVHTLGIGFGVLQAACLTRMLGPEQYGVYVSAAHFVMWTGTAILAFLARPSISWLVRRDNSIVDQSAVVRLYIGMGSIGFLGVLIVSWFTADSAPAFSMVLLFFSGYPLLFVSLGGVNACLNACREYGLVTKGKLVLDLSIPIFTCIAAFFGFGASGVAFGYSIALFVPLFLWRKKIRELFCARSHNLGNINFSKFIIPGLATTCFLLSQSIDIAVLPFALGGADVGYYGAAKYFALIVTPLGNAMSLTLLPAMVRYSRHGKNGAIDLLLGSAFRWICLFMVPLGAVVVERGKITALLYGEDYVGSNALIPWILGAALVFPCWRLSSSWLFAHDYRRRLLALGATGLSVLVVGLFIYLPDGGVLAVAQCFFVASIPIYAVTLCLVLRRSIWLGSIRGLYAGGAGLLVVLMSDSWIDRFELPVILSAPLLALLGTLVFLVLGGLTRRQVRLLFRKD